MAAGRVLADPQLRAAKDLNRRRNKKTLYFADFLLNQIRHQAPLGQKRYWRAVIYIQGVPGGKDVNLGECSLGQTVPI